MKTGFIGCGAMGGGMARRLLESGLPPLCHDPDKAICKDLRSAGCAVADTATEVAGNVDVLILSLPNADIVEHVMSEVHGHVGAGCVVVDTSTSSPDTSRRLAVRARARKYHFLDAPVSGGPTAAITGTMTMLIGGDPDALIKVSPVLDKLGARIVPVGRSGAGHAAKIANNMLCAANLVLVNEAVKLAAASGVSASDLLAGINAGSGRSGVSEVNFPRWILDESFDSGFTMGLMRKDVRLALALADQGNVALPGFAGIASIWAESAQQLPDAADFNRIVEFDSAKP